MFQVLLHDESGVETIEYAILLALVAVAAVVAWRMLGDSVQDEAQAAARRF